MSSAEYTEHDPLNYNEQLQTEEQKLLSNEQNAAVLETDIKWLMEHPSGRRLVWWLLAHAGVNRLTFNTNAMMMAFGEGRRNEGQNLLSKVMEVDPNSYILMLQEALKDEESS